MALAVESLAAFHLTPPSPPLRMDFNNLYINIRMRKSRASLTQLEAMLGADAGVVASGCMSVLLLRGVPGLLPLDRTRAEGLARPSFSSLVDVASAGDAFAQFVAGKLFAEGIGTDRNLESAVRFYQLSADQGNVLVQLNLGWCYQHGKGVAVDVSEAVRLYRLSTDQGDADAQFNLGHCYYHGKGVAVDKRASC